MMQNYDYLNWMVININFLYIIIQYVMKYLNWLNYFKVVLLQIKYQVIIIFLQNVNPLVIINLNNLFMNNFNKQILYLFQNFFFFFHTYYYLTIQMLYKLNFFPFFHKNLVNSYFKYYFYQLFK